MSNSDWLAIAAIAQTVLLAWIAAWQARAAGEVRKVNGSIARHLERTDERLADVEDTSPAPAPAP